MNIVAALQEPVFVGEASDMVIKAESANVTELSTSV